MKTRLDKLLVDKKIIQSRERANRLIKEGGVLVNGKIITKPSSKVENDAKIEVKKEDIKWVSRAGLKLEKAISYWNINPKNFICMDVGASTGGFTDVLLTNGATKVYAIDVGHNQLVDKIKNDSRVINIERVNARNIDKELITEEVDFICIDVSFISLSLILPNVIQFLKKGGEIVALIKPQFEVGSKKIEKGIVKSKKLHEEVVNKIINLANELGLEVKGTTDSPISGSKGNKEFLIYLKK